MPSRRIGVAQAGVGREPWQMSEEFEIHPPAQAEGINGNVAGSHRRRSRHRRSRRSGMSAAEGPALRLEGYLARRDDGKALLVSAKNKFHPKPTDPAIDAALVATLHLDPGLRLEVNAATVKGQARPQVTEILAIEGLTPEDYRAKAIPFSELTSIDPCDRFRLETAADLLEPRVLDLVTPIGRGQRCLIVAPPKAGKTTLLQQIAHAIAINHPEVVIFVLLVDERPEEVTDWKRTIVQGEVFASSSDEAMQSHIEISEMVIERARRLVELGGDVIILMDSLTRMSRAYNNNQKSSGRIMSGGIDARTMEKPRRFFGSARKIEGGGSLTIVATCLVDTGSRMDEVIFQEFKGTGNMEVVLTRDLFERRIFPCVHIPQSGTRKEEKLYPKADIERIFLLRRALAALAPHDAMQLLLSKLKQSRSNAEFLATIQSPAGR